MSESAAGPNQDYFDQGSREPNSSTLAIQAITMRRNLRKGAVKDLESLVEDLDRRDGKCLVQGTQEWCSRCLEIGERVCSTLRETAVAIHPSADGVKRGNTEGKVIDITEDALDSAIQAPGSDVA